MVFTNILGLCCLPMAATAVSVDLACRRYADIGVAVVRQSPTRTDVSFEQILAEGTPKPANLAGALVEFYRSHGSKTLLLDGPQGWKAIDNGLQHSRVCERELNTPAKTGLPGAVKPANYTPFVRFSIEVFDELAHLE